MKAKDNCYDTTVNPKLKVLRVQETKSNNRKDKIEKWEIPLHMASFLSFIYGTFIDHSSIDFIAKQEIARKVDETISTTYT